MNAAPVLYRAALLAASAVVVPGVATANECAEPSFGHTAETANVAADRPPSERDVDRLGRYVPDFLKFHAGGYAGLIGRRRLFGFRRRPERRAALRIRAPGAPAVRRKRLPSCPANAKNERTTAVRHFACRASRRMAVAHGLREIERRRRSKAPCRNCAHACPPSGG